MKSFGRISEFVRNHPSWTRSIRRLFDCWRRRAGCRSPTSGAGSRSPPRPCTTGSSSSSGAGVITGYGARIDAGALGLGLSALVAVEASGSLDALERRLAAFPEVEACWSTAGTGDLMLKVRTADPPAMERLLVRLRELRGVDRTRATILLGHPVRARDRPRRRCGRSATPRPRPRPGRREPAGPGGATAPSLGAGAVRGADHGPDPVDGLAVHRPARPHEGEPLGGGLGGLRPGARAGPRADRAQHLAPLALGRWSPPRPPAPCCWSTPGSTP